MVSSLFDNKIEVYPPLLVTIRGDGIEASADREAVAAANGARPSEEETSFVVDLVDESEPAGGSGRAPEFFDPKPHPADEGGCGGEGEEPNGSGESHGAIGAAFPFFDFSDDAGSAPFPDAVRPGLPAGEGLAPKPGAGAGGDSQAGSCGSLFSDDPAAVTGSSTGAWVSDAGQDWAQHLGCGFKDLKKHGEAWQSVLDLGKGLEFFELKESQVDPMSLKSGLHFFLAAQLNRKRLGSYVAALEGDDPASFWDYAMGKKPERGRLGGFWRRRAGARALGEGEARLAERFKAEALRLAHGLAAFVRFDFGPGAEEKMGEALAAFAALSSCSAVWSVPSFSQADMNLRVPARLGRADPEEVRSANFPAMAFDDGRGATIYLYPAFCVLHWARGGCAVIGADSLSLRCETLTVPETGDVPPDAKVLGDSYRKDESRSFRAPMVAYGGVEATLGKGQKAYFVVSDVKAAENFCSAFTRFLGGMSLPAPRFERPRGDFGESDLFA